MRTATASHHHHCQRRINEQQALLLPTNLCGARVGDVFVQACGGALVSRGVRMHMQAPRRRLQWDPQGSLCPCPATTARLILRQHAGPCSGGYPGSEARCAGGQGVIWSTVRLADMTMRAIVLVADTAESPGMQGSLSWMCCRAANPMAVTGQRYSIRKLLF